MWRRRVFGRVLSDAEVYGVMSNPSQLLRQVSVPARTANFAKAISEALKDNFAIARSPERPNEFVSVPARDIVIFGKAVPDTFAASIAGELTRMHGQFTPDFRISAVETLAADYDGADDVRVFFGRGVFAALDAPQVADLEFCATAKDARPDRSATVVVPHIRGHSGANVNRPAAWYAGQSGIAIGFRPGAAPALILAEEFGQDWEPLLQDLVLFFGRQKDADPVIRGIHLDRTRTEKSTAPPPHPIDFEPDWYSRDGAWQWLQIADRKLWFRFTNRTGASRFSVNAGTVETRARDNGEPIGILVVKGLVLPRMPRLVDFFSGWRVDFQKDETLRHSELLGMVWTAAAQTRARYGIFSHVEGQWKGEEKTSAGEMVLPLGKNRRLDLRYLEDIAPGSFGSTSSSKSERQMRDKIYGSDCHVLMYAESPQSQSDSMGALLLPTVDQDSQWQKFVAEPVKVRGERGSNEPQQPISLDWVNRAASIDGVERGLAEFWLDRWGLEARATPKHLEVKVRFEQEVQSYRIKEGGHGALGPLWIKYVWLAP
jgi:hypothetical protein